MPRYFFDIHDGFEFKDTAGRDMDDIASARVEAMKLASELATMESRQKDGYSIIIDVRDDKGANTLTVRLVCQIDEATRRNIKIAS